MTYATRTSGAWVAVPYGQTITNADGAQASYATVDSWPKADQEAWGAFKVPDPDAPPAGKVEASRVLGGGAAPVWTVTYVNAPPPPPFVVYKADIWRRCTDDEAVQLDGALAQQPVRLRRLFDDAQFLSSDDELFAQIQGATTQLLGADRAAIILAASE